MAENIIILPKVQILDTIGDDAKVLIEENGEINRFAVADLGGDISIDLENVTEGVAHLINADTLGGQLSSYYAPITKLTPRNLLNNSDFTNPVNQRGLNSYNGLFVNCIDRWLIYQISAQAYIHIENGYIRLVPGESLPDWALIQDFPVGTFTAGAYTLAYCDVDGNITINNNPIYEDNDLYSGEVVQRVKLYGTEETKLIWAALYEGEYTAETLPEYQSKGYAAEMAICKQYDPETGDYIGLVPEAIGALSMELLWENASPTSSFVGQTLSLDTKDYEVFAVTSKMSSGTAINTPLHLFLKNITTRIVGFNMDNGKEVRIRQTTANDNGVIFEDATQTIDTAKQTNNTCLIPVKIYGIKGVSV